jgi:hypothetical protein
LKLIDAGAFMRKVLGSSAALLILLSAPAVGQEQREVRDCSRASTQDKVACEARNNAVTHCRLDKSEERFAACVNAALKDPPALRRPGFSKANPSIPAGRTN